MGGAQKSDGPRDNTFCVDTFPIPFPPLTGKKQSRQRMLGATETRCIGNRFDLESFCVRLGRGVGCRVLKGFFLLLCTPCFYASVSFPPSNFPAFPPVHSNFPPSSRQKMCLAWTSFFFIMDPKSLGLDASCVPVCSLFVVTCVAVLQCWPLLIAWSWIFRTFFGRWLAAPLGSNMNGSMFLSFLKIKLNFRQGARKFTGFTRHPTTPVESHYSTIFHHQRQLCNLNDPSCQWTGTTF